MNLNLKNVLLFAVIFCSTIIFSEGLLRRCYQCRSRGDLGSCKDPFTYNATKVENEPGIAAVPCSSGWCGKVMEGGGTYSTDDYDLAVQRMCVQRGPDDEQDRCAFTIYNYKKVYMCFCKGDLCNSSNSKQISSILIIGFIGLIITKFIGLVY